MGKLSRRQFSLRSVLVVIVLAAVWFAYLQRQDAARRQLIEDIQDVGGTVEFGETTTLSLFASQRVTDVAIPSARLGDVGPTRLKLFPNLSTLELNDVEMSGDNGCTFHGASLKFTMVSDDWLKHLDSQCP
ncbi:hypothetical protein Mal15_08940 [Stieleria maiorica]|uniref:Uncharacterized protein n=1 Tax=Stieleria maiorica TaxID=2795974 RepID=A0A5B9MBD1_9BACT|nr:hypothetical protein [Stieleria maiorica]QEF96864.1 hypothetical protein Mal15_08940 [Stieleria maiorica]